MKVISAYAAKNLAKTDKDKAAAWHDAYGVWFTGDLGKSIQEKHGKLSWAYLDTPVSKLSEQEYPVEVWGKQAILIHWLADGYPRGLIAFADDHQALEQARLVAAAKPWSFEPLFSLRNN